MSYGQDLAMINSDLTPEVMHMVDEVLDRSKGKPGCLIPVLEQCQSIVGYLPKELQEYIGSRLDIAGSTIYGVVSFYSFFTMVPRGRHTIRVCLGTACYVRGGQKILEKIEAMLGIEPGECSDDRRFSLETVRCLGACGLAPVIVVDNDTHGQIKPAKIENLLARYT